MIKDGSSLARNLVRHMRLATIETQQLVINQMTLSGMSRSLDRCDRIRQRLLNRLGKRRRPAVPQRAAVAVTAELAEVSILNTVEPVPMDGNLPRSI